MLSRHSTSESIYARKLVDCDDDFDAEFARVLDVLLQVLASLFQSNEILLGIRVVQGLSGGDVGTSAVHLEGASSGDDDSRVGVETTDTALDVAELLHAHVGAETALCQNIANAV